jgi:hypothetical protein
MDSTLPYSNPTYSALWFLSCLTDNEIQRNKEVIILVVQQLRDVISAPPAPSSPTLKLYTFLNLAPQVFY